MEPRVFTVLFSSYIIVPRGQNFLLGVLDCLQHACLAIEIALIDLNTVISSDNNNFTVQWMVEY